MRFLSVGDGEDRPVYGGTPADFAVVQAIQEMKARGLRVTFYPFLLLDVAPGNTKPNLYSANAATSGQPTFPWRGRITCSRQLVLQDRSTRLRQRQRRLQPCSARQRPPTSACQAPLSAGPARSANGRCAG